MKNFFVRKTDKKFAKDFSNEIEPIYTKIEPFTKGEDGKWLNENPYPIWKKTGERNIQDSIQSYEDETNIHNIIARAQQGDFSGLYASKGEYIDVTDIDQMNSGELKTQSIKAENRFKSLTTEEKETLLKILKGENLKETAQPEQTETKEEK